MRDPDRPIRAGWKMLNPGAPGPLVESGMPHPAEVQPLRELAVGGRVLEVGSAYGYSTIAMALVAREVLSVDPHEQIPRSWEEGEWNMAAFGVRDKIKRIREPSHIVLPRLRAAGERFDLVFIDGDHSGPAVRQDALDAVGLAPVLAFHDYGSEPEVAPVLDALFPPYLTVRRHFIPWLLVVWPEQDITEATLERVDATR